MTHQQILEKAIQKAIDGGWFYPTTKVKTFDDDGWIEFEDHSITPSVFGDHLSNIIFNHDFAKALFGIYPIVEAHLVPPIDFEPFQDRSTVEVMLYPTHRYELWKYHLQQMVIADDPIAYLGEHL